MSLIRIKRVDRLTHDSRGTGISIEFGDDTQVTITSNVLRKNCPCASCLEKRGDTSHQNPLQAPNQSVNQGRSLLRVISATSEEETNLEKIWLVGNYALGMKWQDGHDSGIYTFDYLRTLAKQGS